jgi:hypothetical protein
VGGGSWVGWGEKSFQISDRKADSVEKYITAYYGEEY